MDSVLFVGEGDFSFSSQYILSNQKNKVEEHVYATCLCSGSLTEKQRINIDKILLLGGVVHTDVDATQLHLHYKLKDRKFKKIVFNFPHVPGKMNIRKNRNLAQHFLISAEKILSKDGRIEVTLCRGQGGTELEKCIRKYCDTWQIVSLAANASLVLSCTKLFDAKKFATYSCTGFRGQEKAFRTTGALIHTFKRENCLDELLGNIDYKYSASFESLSENIKQIQMRIDKHSAPCLKIQSEFLKFFQLPDSNQICMTDLLVCKNDANFTMTSVPHSMDYDFCDTCLRSMYLPTLNSDTDNVVSVALNVCCVKNIAVNLRPLSHMLAYVCCKIETIFVLVRKLIEFLHSLNFLNNEGQNVVDVSSVWQNVLCIEEELKNQNLNHVEEKTSKVLNIYVTYKINKGDGFLSYSDLEFILSSDIPIAPQTKFKKVGSVIQMIYESSSTFCLLLDLDNLASLKYHVMDYRILVLKDSYYQSHNIYGVLQEVYVPYSIYPPIYFHDISFYVEEDFSESDFYIAVLDILKYIIKSVSLIDTYYDSSVKKFSRCYRFEYQSYTETLTKDKANTIHSQIVRKSLQKSLNITLR